MGATVKFRENSGSLLMSYGVSYAGGRGSGNNVSGAGVLTYLSTLLFVFLFYLFAGEKNVDFGANFSPNATFEYASSQESSLENYFLYSHGIKIRRTYLGEIERENLDEENVASNESNIARPPIANEPNPVESLSYGVPTQKAECEENLVRSESLTVQNKEAPLIEIGTDPHLVARGGLPVPE